MQGVKRGHRSSEGSATEIGKRRAGRDGAAREGRSGAMRKGKDGKGRAGMQEGAGRGPRIPESFTIVQSPGAIEIRDDGGTVVRRVRFAESASGATPSPGGEALRELRGAWRGSVLEATPFHARAGNRTTSFELIDGGEALKITHRMEARDSQPSREFATIYTRVSTS